MLHFNFTLIFQMNSVNRKIWNYASFVSYTSKRKQKLATRHTHLLFLNIQQPFIPIQLSKNGKEKRSIKMKTQRRGFLRLQTVLFYICNITANCEFSQLIISIIVLFPISLPCSLSLSDTVFVFLEGIGYGVGGDEEAY